jgi:hypothetical protein
MSGPTLITPPALGGYSSSALIEVADRRTERRGSKTLDLNAEFAMAVQYLVMECRWSWRRKLKFFTQVPGTWQYDLSASAPGPNAGDIQQFVKHGVRIYPSGLTPEGCELTPLFERDIQSFVMRQNLYTPSPKQPQQYFMNPFLVLNVTPVPDAAYPTSLDYWACPVFTGAAVPEQIPLIPAWMHHVLLKRLEAQIFRYTLGEGAAKYQAAMGEYAALVAQHKGIDGMVPGEHIDWSADDDYQSTFANSQSSVQSTT